MSKGLGKIERRVLDICMGCFRLRKKIIEDSPPCTALQRRLRVGKELPCGS